jgi:hypothetical protein
MSTIAKKSLRVGKYVDENHVDTLIRGYKQERWKYNSERMGREDSLCLSLTVDELQEFLQRSKEAGADSIRVHFGVYPNNFAERPENAGKQTVVFVASQTVETETGAVEKNIFVPTENGPRILAYNMLRYPSRPEPDGRGIADDDWGGIGTTLVDLGNKGMVVV